jgi:hypothetical protein
MSPVTEKISMTEKRNERNTVQNVKKRHSSKTKENDICESPFSPLEEIKGQIVVETPTINKKKSLHDRERILSDSGRLYCQKSPTSTLTPITDDNSVLIKKESKKEIAVFRAPKFKETKRDHLRRDSTDARLLATLENNFNVFMESLGEYEKYKSMVLKPHRETFKKTFLAILKKN